MLAFPTLHEELLLWKQGLTYIAGLDEVGRGAFAGPVVAAAVILPKTFPLTLGIHDSKLLNAAKRERLSLVIKERAIGFSIAEISVETINAIGVGKAAQQAFALAVKKLTPQPDHLLIDAFYIQTIERKKQKAIIKGDQLCLSIAAASIIAKVYRDKLMKKLGEQYAVFRFGQNKGYGTAEHRKAITTFGLCPLHRTSFSLQKYLTKKKSTTIDQKSTTKIS